MLWGYGGGGGFSGGGFDWERYYEFMGIQYPNKPKKMTAEEIDKKVEEEMRGFDAGLSQLMLIGPKAGMELRAMVHYGTAEGCRAERDIPS